MTWSHTLDYLLGVNMEMEYSVDVYWEYPTWNKDPEKIQYGNT